MADELAALVLSGEKTATCSAYRPDKFVPPVGYQYVLTAGDGMPVCVLEVIASNIVPFNEITAAFAAKEGEGDKSLAYWRKVHEIFFKNNGDFAPDMLLICEEFKVVHKL